MNNIKFLIKAAVILLAAFLFLNSSKAQNQNSAKNWNSIADGINYLELDSNSNRVFIGFGGWTVKQSWTNNWVKALSDFYLKEKGVGKYYSVKGPDDVLFQTKNDISIDSLILSLNPELERIDEIIISAHSSGSFVSNYFLNHFLQSERKFPKIIYFNLDGGIGENETFLDSTIAERITNIYSVSIFDKRTKTFSANFESMKEVSTIYSNAEFLLINIDGSRCSQDAKWCLHDRLIISKPNNPEFYDLENDYNNFSEENPPALEYLKIYNH